MRNGNTVEISYNVSGSFKGILRLSPNNYNLLGSENEAIGKGVAYKDSIDNYFIAGAIPVSDSNGNILDLKFSNTAVEANNIFVIGDAESNRVKMNTTNKGKFILNGINQMPHKGNKIQIAPLSNFDVIPIDNTAPVTEDEDTSSSDKSAIAVSKTSSEQRTFVFENTRSLIRDIIIDALLGLKTVPTRFYTFCTN